MYYELYNVDKGYCNVVMDNNKEQREKLMSMMLDRGIIIQKFYWRSIFDDTYLELMEPAIYDAFKFHVDFIGDIKIINEVMEEYIKIQDTYGFLDKCLNTPYTEEEIKSLADKCLQHMEIFC